MNDPVGTITGLRVETGPFEADVEAMRKTLEGSLGAGAERAGRAIEGSLLRAARTGKFGFEDLKRTALGVLAEIATAALHSGMRSAIGGDGASLSGMIAGLTGLPGRATGGPVAPGRGYMVGERGPELFVPTSSGRVETGSPGTGGARDVRVTIQVQAGAGEAPAALQRSSRQVARAVRAALEG